MGTDALAVLAAVEHAPDFWANLWAVMPRLASRLHPLLVHFPIALVLVAAAAEFVRALGRRSGASPFGVRCAAIGVLALGAAAGSGWLNADLETHGRAVESTIFWHRWIGIAALAAVTTAVLVAATTRANAARARGATTAYRGVLLVGAALVAVGGHFGGELVHGPGYVTAALGDLWPDTESRVVAAPPVEPPAPTVTPVRETPEAGPVESDADPSAAFAVFEARCVSCHGPSKQKGRLRLDAHDQVFRGSADTWTVVPGDPDASEIFVRITLPADDPDRMPARGEPLDAEEVAVIRRWIAAGAAAPAAARPVAAAAVDAEPQGEAAGAGREPEPRPAPQPEVVDRGAGAPAPERAAADESPWPVLDAAQRAARDRAVATLRERGVMATRIASDVDAVEVSFGRLGENARDGSLDLLAGLEPALLWLNLSETAITDEGMKSLARFRALRRLRVDQTAFGDGGARALAALPRLEVVNAWGTKMTDEGLAALVAAPSLRRVYAWQTAVTRAGADAARAKGILVDLGGGFVAAADPEGERAVAPAGEPAPCCAKAEAAGDRCAHPCCVEAATQGLVCVTCGGTLPETAEEG